MHARAIGRRQRTHTYARTHVRTHARTHARSLARNATFTPCGGVLFLNPGQCTVQPSTDRCVCPSCVQASEALSTLEDDRTVLYKYVSCMPSVCLLPTARASDCVFAAAISTYVQNAKGGSNT
uniref:Uncharacterized protein n=1 Tax=Chrysotila carterae TaxID=13221 RepID=A0A7S4BLE9_CHRCT